jgi:hypothetical protein
MNATNGTNDTNHMILRILSQMQGGQQQQNNNLNQ